MAPSRIDEAIEALIEREGGYSDHPSDRGGPTMYGVTEAVARAYGYTGPMQLLSRATARAIYRDRYWLLPAFDRVHQLSQPVAYELFDTGVNMGVGTAGTFLQRALNVLNRGAKLWPDVVVDGAVGPITRYALAQLLQLRGTDGERVLLAMLTAQQSVRYIELAENSESQEDFEYGWQRARVASD